MEKNPAAVSLGRLGGSVKSAAKTAAARENGKQGGRPKGSFTQERVTSVSLGTRRMSGTDCPIENILYRCVTPSGAVTWQVVYNLCCGVPTGSKTFRTKAAAFAALKG